MSQELKKKTSKIDKLITKPEDIRKVLNHEKTVTRRSARFADVGETMTFQGRTFKMTNVYQQTLGDVTDRDAQNEGYADLQDYKQGLKNIHPFTRMMPFLPWPASMKVWVHVFEEVK